MAGAGEERQEDQQQAEAAVHEALQRLPQATRDPRDSLQRRGSYINIYVYVCVYN